MTKGKNLKIRQSNKLTQRNNPMQKLGVIIVLIMVITSCETSSPSLGNKLQLSLEDVSCTEVWFGLRNENLSQQGELNITLNDSIIKSLTLNSQDTLLYIEDLRPGKTYTFKATYIPKEEIDYIGTSSEELIVRTMDTTNHNFTWQSFTFGSGKFGEYSYLKDVAIIDENNIWAVGEIHTADDWDSEGNYVGPYNAVHWDGSKWELKRIFVFYKNRTNLAPLTGVFALPDGKIIFSSGLPYLPEGNHWKLYHLWDMEILNSNDGDVSAIWGTSIDNLYFAGRKGTIVHYNGSKWEKIESGTEVRLTDIHGTPDGKTVWACGWEWDGSKVIIEIRDGESKVLWDGSQYISAFNDQLHSIWYDGKKVWIGGGTIIWKENKSKDWKEVYLESENSISIDQIKGFIYGLIGTSKNNIYGVGEYGIIWHFNGKTWKYDKEEYDRNQFKRYNNVAIKNNTVAICGYLNGKAIITVNYR